MDAEKAVRELVYRSCLLLDEHDFAGFLNLCDPEFQYTIKTYSPEIKKEMIWLEQDKKGMQSIFNMLPKHNSDHAPLSRHATVYTVGYTEDRKQASAVSALQVFKTALDGGVTELFGVGKLYDTITLEGEGPRLLNRTVKLDTRMLGTGSHIPF